MKMRGQAHVTFRDIQTATQAMRALQGFEFFGREMVCFLSIVYQFNKANIKQQIQYAKSKSDTIAKLDGTFKMPAAAAGAVTATELQQSIFNAPPSASNTATLPPPPAGTLRPPPSTDTAMEDARSPTTSVVGQKRRRADEDEEEEDSEGDVAMDEDSDDD
jgi:U2 small nuclear ribonucleoprotein B''